MIDPTLFAAGALFTQDYLVEGIRGTAQYASAEVAALRNKLVGILAGFPHDSKPNEATTESDPVWTGVDGHRTTTPAAGEVYALLP